MRRAERSFKPERLGTFELSVFGLVVLVISFALTLAILQQWDDPTSGRERVPITIATAAGLRLTYPAGQQTDHKPDRAFDGSTEADSFWEARGPYPIELTVEFPEPRRLSKYAIDAGEMISRMPLEWVVTGSPDGQKSVVLDHRKIDDSWEQGQSRAFPIAYDQPLRLLHFQFVRGADQTMLRLYEIELH
jgi:hypothetical protein